MSPLAEERLYLSSTHRWGAFASLLIQHDLDSLWDLHDDAGRRAGVQPCSKFWFREATSGLCPGHCSRSECTQYSITPGTIHASLHDYATEKLPAAVVKGVPAVQPFHACCTTDCRLLSSGGCQAPSLPCLRMLHLCKPLPGRSGLYRLAFVCGMVAACRSGDLDHQVSA